MFQFVYWLRALAAILITNSHYADIWPASAMAFGGHYGNCIYFFYRVFACITLESHFQNGTQNESFASIRRCG